MAFQSEEIFELVYDSLYDLSLSRGPAASGHTLRSLFLGVAATKARILPPTIMRASHALFPLYGKILKWTTDYSSTFSPTATSTKS
jgi:hypothetical protein